MTLEITTKKDAQGRHVVELNGDVRAPVRAVWELMSDTQRLNHDVFGLPEMNVVERRTDATVATVATVSVGGIDMVFDEQPWLYESPRRYKSVRVFTKGPLERLETSCELDDVAIGASGSGTRVHYAVALAARGGPVGWAASKLFVAQMESGVEKLKASVLHLDEGRPPPAFVHPERAATRKKADAFRDPLMQRAKDMDAVLVEGLLEHIAAGPDDEVARIRPYALAEKWKQHRDSVLALSLDAVGAGLLQMRWETICPSCKGPVHNAAKLDDVPDRHTCPMCNIDVDASRTSNVSAVFQPVFDVRKAQAAYYCLGSPNRTPHWLAQVVLAPGEERDLVMTLGFGRFLVTSPGIDTCTVLDVGENGDSRVRVTLEGPRGTRTTPALPGATPPVLEGRVTVALKNEDESARMFRLVHEGYADLAATAAHASRRLHGNDFSSRLSDIRAACVRSHTVDA